MAKTLKLWQQESDARQITLRSYDGSTYRLQYIDDDELVSTLQTARLIDIVERPAEVTSLTKRINNYLLGL